MGKDGDKEGATNVKVYDEKVSNELNMMKAELEKQRLTMQERENEWIAEKNIEREKLAAAARQEEKEERERKEQTARSAELQASEDRRREIEREDRKREIEREDKRRDMERDDRRREQDREDTIRENEREDKKRVEREAKVINIREEELTIREERLVSERKKAQEEKSTNDRDVIGSYKRDIAVESHHQSVGTVCIENYDKQSNDAMEVDKYAPNKEPGEQSLAPPTASFTPKNMPFKSAMGFRESIVERDSLDIDLDIESSLEIKGKTLHSNVTGVSRIGGEDLSGQLPDVSTIEHDEEDSFDSHMLGLDGRDEDDDVDRDFENRISGPTLTERKKLFRAVSDTSIDSDEMSGSGSGSDYQQKKIMENPEKVRANVKNVEEDGGSVSKIVSLVDKVKSKEDMEKEETERIEIDKKMIATQLAKEEQEKKEADMKAIQDARASVIARRKQKSERDAVAASLSALPSKAVEKPISVSASTPHTFAPSKYHAQSSSDESVSPDESDKMINKSKSVIGVSFFYREVDIYTHFITITSVFLS